MRKIIIPVDFSEKTFNTVQYGVNLAQYYGSTIELLYVVNLAYYGATYSTPADMATIPEVSQEVEIKKIQTAEKSFEKMISQLKKDFDVLPDMQTEIKSGIEADIIEAEILEKNFDLLLLTGNENSGFLKFISNENHTLIQNAKCPVIIVPNSFKFKIPERVIYATDFSEADVETMTRLVEFLRPFNCSVNALHITNNLNFKDKIRSEGFREYLKQEVKYDDLDVFTLPGDDIAESVLKFAEQSHTDIISVLKENRGFFARLFHHSITEDLADHASLPVLIFHEQKK